MNKLVDIYHHEALTIRSLEISHVLRQEPNRHGQAVYEQVYQITQQMGLVIDPINYANHITMSGYIWPHASAERLAVLAYFNTLGYFLNDRMGRDIVSSPDVLRANVVKKAYSDLVEGVAIPPLDTYDHAFIHLRKAILARSNEAFAGRFFPLLLKHWQAGIQKYDPYQGTLKEYIATRRHASGMLPTLMLIEFACGCYMPRLLPQVVPNLEIAVNALADVGAISNDIFSFAKERHTTFNIVRVLQREHGYDNDDIISPFRDAFRLTNQRYQTFKTSLDIIQEQAGHIEDMGLRSEVNRFLKCFVDGMWNVAAACYHWQIETNRYRHDNHPITDLQRECIA